MVVPTWLAESRALSSVDLSHNQLTTLPETLFHLPHLHTLQVCCVCCAVNLLHGLLYNSYEISSLYL
jgi:Leucine-rich repeat (LRR) protein